MLKAMKQFAKRVPLDERTDAKFWDDPHISQGML